MDRIKELENLVTESNSNLNNLVELLEFQKNPDTCVDAIHALYRIFSTFISSGIMKGTSESSKIVAEWIKRQYTTFLDQLFLSIGNSTVAAIQVNFDFFEYM